MKQKIISKIGDIFCVKECHFKTKKSAKNSRNSIVSKRQTIFRAFIVEAHLNAKKVI